MILNKQLESFKQLYSNINKKNCLTVLCITTEARDNLIKNELSVLEVTEKYVFVNLLHGHSFC